MNLLSAFGVFSVLLTLCANVCADNDGGQVPSRQDHIQGAGVGPANLAATPAHRSPPSAAPEPYERSEAAENGTPQLSSVKLAPRFLVATFGKPGKGDRQKCSGIYIFSEVKYRTTFTVYDWNSTSLSEYGADLPSPAKFWASTEGVEFQIGGKDGEPVPFTEWLLAKYRLWQRARPKR